LQKEGIYMSTYKKDEELLPFSYQPYQKSDSVKQAEALLKQHTANRPAAYQPQYKGEMDNIRSQIENRKPFQYDVNGDALYNQYKDRYIHNGQRAMMDTMGQAAALTGGYGSSYAQNVGQQAYNEYMTGLNDVIPELYQLALDRYDREGDALKDRYAMYADLDAQGYSRWQDGQSAYYSQLDRLTENARYEQEQDWSKYAAGYDAAYAQYEKSMKEAEERAAAAAEQETAANAPLQKYKYAGIDDSGNYRYYLGDKQVTYEQGINPHAGTRNPDVQYGTFGVTGYQPNNIGGKPLSKAGPTAIVNGHEQNVWKLPDGSTWVWDDTKNKYVEHQAGARSFISQYMTRDQAAQRGITAKEWKDMIMDGLHNVNLTADEFERLEKYYGLNL
jgi:hypothetical protein